MEDPVFPARFVHPQDVAARYEGTIPAELMDAASDPPGRIRQRIIDVESELMGFVPSLRVLDPVTGDGDRVRRVKRLVADKVLEVYRNPSGAATTTSDMDGFSETVTLRGARAPSLISFTDAELNQVRLRKSRRRFGTVPVGPGAYGPC